MPVKFIGIELEGAFNSYNGRDTLFHQDGSVEIEDSESYECDCCRDMCDHSDEIGCYCECTDKNYNYVGELVSKKLTFAEMPEWVTRNYPLKFNKSCGMHVHFSFKNDLEYSKFCSKEFYDYFIAEITKWAKNNGVKSKLFLSRLKGENYYCRNRYDCKGQLNDCGDRYSILNYCYKKHRTVEIRLSHLWVNKDFAIRYIEACHDIFNMWLLTQKRVRRYSLNVVTV